MSDELLLSSLGKNPVYSSDKITQVKTLCNVVQEAPDNIAQEKKPVQCCLNTLGTTLHR